MNNRTSTAKFCCDCGRQINGMLYLVGMDYYCASCYVARYVAVVRQTPAPVIPGISPEQDHAVANQMYQQSQRDMLVNDMTAVLDYIKAGQYGSGEDVDLKSGHGIDLFNAVRGLMADAIAGYFLADEVKRLDEREQRFKNDCDALNRIIRCLLNQYSVPSSVLVALVRDANVDMGAILNERAAWYHFTQDEVLALLAKAEISEGKAAEYLDMDRMQVRVLMEAKFGAHWRDIASDD